MKIEDLRESWQKFVGMYEDELFHKDAKPRNCINRAVEELGRDNVVELLATVTLLHRHDGRISDANKKFCEAVQVNPAAVADRNNAFIYVNPSIDSIHPAHLNQMLNILRKG